MIYFFRKINFFFRKQIIFFRKIIRNDHFEFNFLSIKMRFLNRIKRISLLNYINKYVYNMINIGFWSFAYKNNQNAQLYDNF